MEGRINPSPVLNAPPAKESDPFLHVGYSSAVTALQAKHTSKRRVSAAFSPSSRPSQRCFQPSLLLLPMCDFGPRPFLETFDLGLDVRSVLFVLPTSSIQGALRLGRCRRSRSFCWAASSARPGCVTRCSVRPILEVPRYPPFPCSPFDGLSNDRYRLRPSQRSQHLEWPLCAKTGPSLNVAFDPQTNKRTRTRPDAF